MMQLCACTRIYYLKNQEWPKRLQEAAKNIDLKKILPPCLERLEI